MARVPSTMVPLGRKAPEFDLPDPQGNRFSLQDFEDADGLLVMFICNHCPFVKHLKPALAEFAREYRDKGLGIVAINSNDPERHPADRPEKMAEDAETFGYPFPYLHDDTQEVAKDYGAACTPDFFLFDRDRRLVYRGQFDDSRPGNDRPVTGRDLRAAADAVLAGEEPSHDQTPSIGCNIKWKPGNEPTGHGPKRR